MSDPFGSATMERVELEVYSFETNAAVVRMPGRRFPGLVIQGDSLSILLHRVQSILDRVQELPDGELCDDVEEVRDILLGYLRTYEDILVKSGFQDSYGSTPGSDTGVGS
jgi:hypothetical protein